MNPKRTIFIILCLLIYNAAHPLALAADWPADSGTLIADATNLGAGYEPSGAVWHSQLNKLIIVGDGGDVTIIDANGNIQSTWHPGGDIEGVTIANPSSNYIYLGIEQPDSIKEFNISTGTLTGKVWDLTQWMTGPSNSGLEALTFVPNGKHPYANSTSGGLFYAGLQNDGKIYVFDINLSTNGNVTHVDTITPLPGHTDISGLYYNSTTNTLYAIFDNDNLLVEMEPDGTVVTEYTLPGNEQEGIAVVTSYPSTNAQVYITEDTPPKVWRYNNYPVQYPLLNITSYANAYKEYTQEDLNTLKKFDLVVIDPYDVPNQTFVTELKANGTIVIAYIDIGEAEEYRSYWKTLDKSILLAKNPDWPGCWYVDANNPKWHDVVLNKEIPYILQLGNYDGLCMDMLDTVDIYPNLKPGMISLIKEIWEKYPDLILIPNRGFAILSEISSYIDAIKYEEMNARYDFELGDYVYEDDEVEKNILLNVLVKNPMPVLVLDHVETIPMDTQMAEKCYSKTAQFAKENGIKCIWYANSVNQDLPIWLFLFPTTQSNLTSSCTATASSEYSSAYPASNAIDGIKGVWDQGEWAAQGSWDKTPWLNLTWTSPQTVNKMIIYGRPNKHDSIQSAKITLSNGYSVNIGEIPIGGAAKEVYFPSANITWLRFEVIESNASNAGLAELEVYYEPPSQNTSNLASSCTATASSEYSSQYLASNAIDGIKGVWDQGEWAAQGSWDKTPWLKLQWTQPQTVNKIIIYGRPNKHDSIQSAKITLSNGYSVNIGEIPIGGAAKEVYFPTTTITWLKFEVLESNALNAGLAELEVYYQPEGQNTSNLALSATATASSEYSPQYRAPNAIDGIKGVWDQGEWAAQGSWDRTPWLKLTWTQPQTVNKIILYGRPNKYDSIQSAKITLSNGYSVNIGEIPIGGAAKEIYFPVAIITWLKFEVLESNALNAGLAELEVYYTEGSGNPSPTPPNDSDNDSIYNTFDTFPNNPIESVDTDSDGIGNITDIDDDNDSVSDADDEFPYNSTKSKGKHSFTVSCSMPTSWDKENAWDSFLKNITVLDEINPYWYEMQADGTLTTYSGAKDTRLIELAHDNNLLVIPYISNNFDPARVNSVINNSAKTISHIQNILTEVIDNNYDGINIDYESCYASDRNAFTKFIKNLAVALHNKGKLLEVSIHAKTSEPGEWDGAKAQDWEKIGEVVDKFRIMTYDYSWDTSPPGPIAPIDWIEEVTGFALTKVDSKKLIMGIPSYGYDWVGNNGTDKTWLEVQELINTYNIIPNWDNTAQEPYLEYYNGIKSHTVYYQDHQSISPKLNLYINYDVKGISIWRIGSEDPENWDVIKEHVTYSPTTQGSLQTYIEIIESFIPGKDTEAYKNPTALEKNYFQDIIDYILSGQFSLAEELAQEINYGLSEFLDKSDNKKYYIIREDFPITKGWGTYVFNPDSKKDLLIETPHPLYEPGTAKAGAETFLITGAKAFLLAGTHRYANSDKSSDVAHNQNSIFELVHELISTQYSRAVQLHGFSSTKHPGYPDVILSNGTPDPLQEFYELKNSLATYGISAGIYDGINYSDLGATTNVQGQYTNSIGGKFFHIELSDKLRNDSTKIENLITVIKNISSLNLIVSCLGDSVTNGYPYDGTDKTYPSKLKVMLKSAYSNSCETVDVINRGVNGYRADQVLDNIYTYLEDNPTYVLLMVGGNDLAQEVLPDKSNFFAVVNQTVSEVQDIIDIVKSHTNPDGSIPKIIVSTFIPVKDPTLTLGLKVYNNALINNLTGMDLLITTNWEDFYDPSTKQAYSSLMSDTVHPNEKGYTIMAENWFSAINSIGTTSKVKNIILIIGDGMGFEHVKAGRIFSIGPNGSLNMETLDNSGEVTTNSLTGVTDSAAASTAIATGNKAYNGYLSQSKEGKEYKTILEYAKILGKRTGLVTTTEITDATPAGFGSHTNSRYNWDEIANGYIYGSEPNILFGGGKKYWLPSTEPGSVRSDNGLIDDAELKGYTYIDTQGELDSLIMNNEDKVLGLFSLSHMTYEYEKTGNSTEPDLSKMVERALDLLEEDPDGFFLMIEGGRIDHAGHSNNITNTVYETQELDNAISIILSWVIAHPDTLIIITADHETGGLKVLSGNYSIGQIPNVTWSTTGHTGANVPIWAKGPESTDIHNTIDNIDIFSIMLNSLVNDQS